MSITKVRNAFILAVATILSTFNISYALPAKPVYSNPDRATVISKVSADDKVFLSYYNLQLAEDVTNQLYHYSHRSHSSHTSHQSHVSHYSSSY